MRIRLLKVLTPLLQPLYRRYVARERSYRYHSIRVRVAPGVFYPGWILSTKVFLNYIDQLPLSGKSLLEIGAGSGIIAILAARKGADVTATDINPVAVKNMIENAQLNHVKIRVVQSDLFESVSAKRFDYIVVTPPYYPKAPADFAEMAWYCGANFEYFTSFFMQLSQFYHSEGVVLMILSEDCNVTSISEIAAQYGFSFVLYKKSRNFGESNFIYRIIK